MPIEATTDLQDVTVWNGLLARVHALMVNSNYWSGHAVPTPPVPTLTPGRPNVNSPIPGVLDDPLYTSAFGSRPGFNAYNIDFRYKSVAEMQGGLYQIMNGYGYDNYLLGQALGYPVGSAGDGVPRRRHPRRIFQRFGRARSQWYTYASGFGFFTLHDIPYDCVPGDRAQFYNSSSYFSQVAVPGGYLGVYEYAGGGNWFPAPNGATADVLDSINAAGSRLWCFPGAFDVGDYFGWELLREIEQTCELFEAYSP